MFRLPPPTFTHHAPLHVHPPFIRAPLGVTSNTNAPFSLGAQHDLMFRPPPPTFSHHAPPSPLVLPAIQQMIIQPPALPAGGTESQELVSQDQRDDGRPYVKKPPNAFMLFLKEIRPKVVSELNISRSVMVNRVVGEMWKSLPVEVKARYSEKARLEQRLHQQQHPGWSTGDNYVCGICSNMVASPA
uniref:HMG box domain-containing protein n=1 Tax=Poecilia latipinna TaxID=48699 RepID=A0A3B3V6N6_9TELE